MVRWLGIGLESAKANIAPMVSLWSAAVVLVLGYYFVPCVTLALEPFARFQREYGPLAAFSGQMFFSGFLPGLFLLALKSIRPRRPLLTVLAQGIWCGIWGIACDRLFRLMTAWFGDGNDITTLLLKMSVDQFVWTVVFIAPANALFFFWLGRDFSLERVKRQLPKRFFLDLVAPNLFANWCVWIPVSMVVFAFPLDLQIHINGFACAFWTLMCLQIGRRTA